MTLDYIKEGLNEFFKFINPNEQSSCGCGGVQFNETSSAKVVNYNSGLQTF